MSPQAQQWLDEMLSKYPVDAVRALLDALRAMRRFERALEEEQRS